jgi:DNA-nicking Smr family endonuclease
MIGAVGRHIDTELWRTAMREVTPLGRRASAVPSAVPPSAIPPPPPAGAAVRGEQPPGRGPEQRLDRFADIDRASAERLKRGLREIEARLDLHGMTQAEAHRALAAFVAASVSAGRRCVLVITGRGLNPNGPGVLKSGVPRWLAEADLRRQILAIAPAQPRHGGAGALYLLLRRRR